MLLSPVFDRFVMHSPISVMARALMEAALTGEALDDLFRARAGRQYTRHLLFSSVVDLMTVVVCKMQPSMHAAFQAVAATMPVSITALYKKLNGTETAVAGALAEHTAGRLAPVIRAMGGEMPALLPGRRVRIIDGNHFASTERRLEVLRGSVAGPLPGQALVVLDPQLMLATHMIPCEDGHAQERSLFPAILELTTHGDVWMADRNFCTAMLLFGIAARAAHFVIRQHASIRIVFEGPSVLHGRTDTGTVFEQEVVLEDATGHTMRARRVIIRLDKHTRDGDSELAILTNLSPSEATAIAVAECYRKRWTLETLFQQLTKMLRGEIDTLAYPGAAVLGFAVALAAYNVLSTAQAALRGKFGGEHVTSNVSEFYLANEVRATLPGMSVALDASAWRPFRQMRPEELARHLLAIADHVSLARYQRHPRGAKKPVPKRTRYQDETHVSTARLLAAKARKPSR